MIFHYCKSMSVGFSILRYDFTFQIFFVEYRFSIKICFGAIFNFLLNFISFNNSSCFTKKDIYLASSKSLLYVFNITEFCNFEFIILRSFYSFKNCSWYLVLVDFYNVYFFSEINILQYIYSFNLTMQQYIIISLSCHEQVF